MKKIFIIFSFILILPIRIYAESQAEIKIGWIGPLTGSAAALGVDSVPAIEIVFDEINAIGGINGRKLKLVVEDDQYETSKTVSAYNKLVNQEHISILYIITYGGLFALADKAEKDGVLLLDPLDCDDAIAKLPSNTICVAKKTEDLGRIIAEAAIQNGDIPAGLIYFAGDPFMGTAGQASEKTFQAVGKDLKFSEGYIGGTTDFKPILLKAKQAGLKSLFFFGYDEMGFAMKQARQIGISIPFYSMNTITSPGYKDSAGAAAEGAHVVNWLAPRTNEYEEFMKKFKKRVGRGPFLEISTIPSYDIASLLVNFFNIHKADPDSPEKLNKIKNNFYSLKDYVGLSGLITIDPDGITRSLKNKMYIFEKGELK